MHPSGFIERGPMGEMSHLLTELKSVTLLSSSANTNLHPLNYTNGVLIKA